MEHFGVDGASVATWMAVSGLTAITCQVIRKSRITRDFLSNARLAMAPGVGAGAIAGLIWAAGTV